jgi:putative ABC transport system permease protein
MKKLCWLAIPVFLKVFSFELLKGNRATALAQANEILITEEAATRFFGSADPLGKNYYQRASRN